MASNVQLPPLLLLIVLLPAMASTAPASTPAFDENYVAAWGADGYHLVNQGTEIRLAMDKSSGAGFGSKSSYGSGFFHMRIKVPGGYTAGVVTAFYVSYVADLISVACMYTYVYHGLLCSNKNSCTCS